MNIREINNIEGFEKLKDKWDILVNKIGSPKINSYYSWNYLIYKNLFIDNKLFILIAEDERGIAGIAPLKIQNTKKILLNYKIASFIGNEYSDWNDFIILRDNEKVINGFVNYVFKNNINEILLNNINEHSPNFQLFEKLLSEEDSVKEKTKCYYIKTYDNTWDYYLKNNTSKKFVQRDLNRLNNKFNEHNWEVTEIKDDYNEFLEIIKGFHKQSQNRKNRNSIYEDKRFMNFIRSIFDEWVQYDRIKLFLLTLDGTPLSFAIIFYDDNKYYWWQTGFNTEYSKFSPTKFLVSELIKKSFHHKIDEFHFMRGEDEYKTKWTENFTNNFRFRFYNKNLFSYINSKIKKIKNHI